MDDALKKVRNQLHREWVEKNREHVNEYQRQWRKRNPDKMKKYRENHLRKKAKELGIS